MKTNFHGEVLARSGTNKRELLTYCSYENGTVCIKKNWFPGMYPTPTHLAIYNEKIRHSAQLYKTLSPAFITDLKRYAQAYNSQVKPAGKLSLSSYTIWTMATTKHPTPFNTLAEIDTAFGSTLTDWINSDHLPKVRTTNPFTTPVTP